jgi:hypothetical protein
MRQPIQTLIDLITTSQQKPLQGRTARLFAAKQKA